MRSSISGEFGILCVEQRHDGAVTYLGCPNCRADLDYAPVFHNDKCTRSELYQRVRSVVAAQENNYYSKWITGGGVDWCTLQADKLTIALIEELVGSEKVE